MAPLKYRIRNFFNFILGRQKPNPYKPIILITGCSSGIGMSLAEIFYDLDEYRIVATARARSIERLRQRFPESERFKIKELDITLEEQRQAVVNDIKFEWGSIDVLINNAGVSYRSVVEHMTESDELIQMQTNYFGSIGMIRLCLPEMRSKGRGKIICISSVSGMLAMPTMGSYSASKYALEGACEALWYETKPLGINVSLVQPGFVHSDSFKNILYTQQSNPENPIKGPYHDYYENMSPFVEKLMKLSITSPSDVARKIIKVIRTENPPLWLPATPDAIIFFLIRRLLPRRWILPFLLFCLPNSNSWASEYTKKRK
jgi:short-subunit dehydrogenase